MVVQPDSTITCPNCGFQKREQMPEDAVFSFMNVSNVNLFSNLFRVTVAFFAVMEQRNVRRFKKVILVVELVTT